MKKLIFLIFLLSTTTVIVAQSYLEWESYTVDEFYEKVELKDGSLDEDGNPIEYVYVTTEIEEGVYEIEITDDEGDLYEIKNTGYYITFRGFYGFAGFGEEGILVVGKSSWSSTFYKNPN